MPSSARQRLPADMWQGSRLGSSTTVMISGYDVQACPGWNEELKQQKSPNRKKTRSNKRHASNKAYNKNMVFHNQGFGGSTQDDLAYCEWVKTDDNSGSSSESATSSDSDSNIESNARHVVFSGTFANNEESLVPSVADVPLPPIEWLKPSSNSPLTVGKSLHAMLMGFDSA